MTKVIQTSVSYHQWLRNPEHEPHQANPDLIEDLPQHKVWQPHGFNENEVNFLVFIRSTNLKNVLSERQASALKFRVQAGLSLQQIADTMKISQPSVRELLKRASSNILKLYQKESKHGTYNHE